jgi:predicted ABC-type sugar transport system permease subunit
MSGRRTPSSAVTSFVVASRFMPAYIAIALLVLVASIWAPRTLAAPGLRAIAPFGTFLAIAALGQMLVIMTGGIDLSVPGASPWRRWSRWAWGRPPTNACWRRSGPRSR